MAVCNDSFGDELGDSPESAPIYCHTSLISDVLYHLCRAVPHLTLFIYNNKTPTPVLHEFPQLSAKIAFGQVLSITNALVRLLASPASDKLNSLPPFVGYSAFVAASLQLSSFIHLQYLGTGSRLLDPLRSHLLVNLLVLDRLRCIWMPLDMMVRFFTYHEAHPTSLY